MWLGVSWCQDQVSTVGQCAWFSGIHRIPDNTMSHLHGWWCQVPVYNHLLMIVAPILLWVLYAFQHTAQTQESNIGCRLVLENQCVRKLQFPFMFEVKLARVNSVNNIVMWSRLSCHMGIQISQVLDRESWLSREGWTRCLTIDAWISDSSANAESMIQLSLYQGHDWQ